MALAAGLDEHDHLVVGVVRDVPPVDQDDLIALVEAGHAQVRLQRKTGQLRFELKAVLWGRGLPMFLEPRGTR